MSNMNDDDEYFSFLATDYEEDEARPTLRGIPPEDSYPESTDSPGQQDNVVGFFNEGGEMPYYEGRANVPWGQMPSVRQNKVARFAMATAPASMRYNKRGDRDRGRDEPRGRDACWYDGRPVMKEVHYNKLTATAPTMAPFSERKEIKQQIRIQTINTIRGTFGYWPDKAECLANIFAEHVPGANLEAITAISDIKNSATDAWVFDSLNFIDATGTVLEPEANGAIPGETRAGTTWIQIEATLVATDCRVNAGMDVSAENFPEPASTVIFIRAPAGANGELHPAITAPMATDIDRHKDIIAAFATIGVAFTETIQDPKLSIFAPTREQFIRWRDIIYYKAKFEAIALATLKHVGKLAGTSSLASRLRDIRQKEWDPVNKMCRFYPVHTIHKRIDTMLMEINPEKPPSDLPKLVDIAHHALSRELQENTIDHIPEASPANFMDNQAQMIQFFKVCRDEETKLKQMVRVANNQNKRVGAPRHAGRPVGIQQPAGRAFHAFQTMPRKVQRSLNYASQQSAPYFHIDTNPYAVECGPNATLVAHNKKPDGITMPEGLVMKATQDPMAEMLKQAICCMAHMEEDLRGEDIQGFVGASSAEAALAEASGTRFPHSCLGCGQTGHIFKHCPHKNDPTIMQKFYENFKKWREERRQKRQNQHGYYNSNIKNKVGQIADGRAGTSERQNLLVSLATDIREATGTSPNHKSARASRRGMQFATFVDTSQKGMEENPFDKNYSFQTHQKQLAFSINNLMPFLEMPIGDNYENNTTLKGLFDSGGCCNLGWKPHHLRVAEKHPELTREVTELSVHNYEPIKIGGIEGHVKITHLISYRLPCETDAKSHTLTIGLTDTLPLNTLCGLPFIVKANLKPDWKRQTVHSDVFEDELNLVMERPQLIPPEDLDHSDPNRKIFLTQNGEAMDLDSPDDLVA